VRFCGVMVCYVGCVLCVVWVVVSMFVALESGMSVVRLLVVGFWFSSVLLSVVLIYLLLM